MSRCKFSFACLLRQLFTFAGSQFFNRDPITANRELLLAHIIRFRFNGSRNSKPESRNSRLKLFREFENVFKDEVEARD